MHRLTPFVVLLVVSALASGGMSFAAMSAMSSARSAERDSLLSGAVLFGSICFGCMAQAAVMGTLVAIERKVNRMLSSGEESPALELSRNERRAIRSSLPPRQDGRL